MEEQRFVLQSVHSEESEEQTVDNLNVLLHLTGTRLFRKVTNMMYCEILQFSVADLYRFDINRGCHYLRRLVRNHERRKLVYYDKSLCKTLKKSGISPSLIHKVRYV